MSKKKKKEKRQKPKHLEYEEALEQMPGLEGTVLKSSWNYVGRSNESTKNHLLPLWLDNIRGNVKQRNWNRRRCVKKLRGLAFNKAVIGVGAGQSFNKNKHVLKQIVDIDGVKDWNDRNFVIIASNHQYKPLLDMGIIPDFVLIIDGGKIGKQQLTVDVPPIGKNTILLAGLQCDPETIGRWLKQGREVLFWITYSKELRTEFQNLTGRSANHYMVLQGGNVLNLMVGIASNMMGSNVFMALGNDLSYEVKDDLDVQRQSYYADGDYTSNAPKTGSGRDEAAANKKWLGFTLRKKPTNNGKIDYDVDLHVVGTSPTLWVYKTWIESQMIKGAQLNSPLHYYNCSEGGVLGVMAKEEGDENLRKDDNWFMLDEVCPKWHTMTLEDAAMSFLKAKETFRWEGEMRQDALAAEALALPA